MKRILQSLIPQWLIPRYFSMDPRSLGLFRIAYGTLLLVNLWWRYQDVDVWYTNDGLFPNHSLLWRPPARYLISFFFTLSSHDEATAGFLLCAIAFFVFLLGYRTKLFHLLSMVCLFSVNSRISLLENGGDIVMNLLCLYTFFLPLGARFSIDSLLSSMRNFEEKAPADLANRDASDGTTAPVVRLVVFTMILQWTLVYFFNVIHKSGQSWLNGSAVHYTLHQDRLNTAFAVWLRENVPYEALRVLTYGTIVIEVLGVLLIASPFFTRWTRLGAVLLMPTLHAGFASCLDLGPFSYGMMCFFVLLIHHDDWDALWRWFRKGRAERVVFYDSDCGVCLFAARLLARLDRLRLLRLESNQNLEALPEGVTAETVQGTIVVVDTATKQLWTRSAALAAILRMLPLGSLWSVPLRVPGLKQIADLVYDRFAANRLAISVWFGLAACGTPSESIGPAIPRDTSGSAACNAWSRIGLWTGHAAVLLLMVALCGEIMKANASIPRWMRYRQPEFLQKIVEYPRLMQGWRMFAPDAPFEDFMIQVHAITIDGRKVDPYNEVACTHLTPRPNEWIGDVIPASMGQDQYFTAYSLFSPNGNYVPYHRVFEEWILRYPIRTGNPRDMIKSFEVYQLIDRSPPPGKTQPFGVRKKMFMRWPNRL